MTFEKCAECRSNCTEHCFAEAARTIQVPTVAQMRQQIGPREAALDKDLAAYRRLKADGIQPDRTDGAHELEARLTELPMVEGVSNGRRVASLRKIKQDRQFYESDVVV